MHTHKRIYTMSKLRHSIGIVEINGAHGEFHVRAGRDEKQKNYFAWPYSLTHLDVAVITFFSYTEPPQSIPITNARPTRLAFRLVIMFIIHCIFIVIYLFIVLFVFLLIIIIIYYSVF